MTDSDWEMLIKRIEKKQCTPFLGAGACYNKLPLGKEVAKQWADKYQYPLDSTTDLAAVSQFVAIKVKDNVFPKEQLLDEFKKLKEERKYPDFDSPGEPHGLLADLRLPIYLTTNYDDFMYEALRRKHIHAERRYCQWWPEEAGKESKLDFDPTAEKPVVFHLHGYEDDPRSLVLTEDDYLDFLVNVSRDPDVIPKRIREAFANTTLLFLGYSTADWNFRVVFRNLVTYVQRSQMRCHVSVQLVPDTAPSKDAAQEYLNQYFGHHFQVRMFWGTCDEFIQELRKRIGG